MDKKNKEEKITGLLFVRKVQDKKLLNKSLYIITGVIGLPDNVILKSEHQYLCIGKEVEGILSLNIMTNYSKDISDISIGNTPNGLLCQPIWQI